MRKGHLWVSIILILALFLFGCGRGKDIEQQGSAGSRNRGNALPNAEETVEIEEERKDNAEENQKAEPVDETEERVTEGTESYQGFLLDNVLHSPAEGDIHYNVYVPETYDGTKPYAVFFTLPGYEGLYFQGVGVNLRSEAFGFTAQSYLQEMIVVAPQLNDWGETSARQTIALVEYFLSHYNIDKSRVYANGYSGGGALFSEDEGIMGWLFGQKKFKRKSNFI